MGLLGRLRGTEKKEQPSQANIGFGGVLSSLIWGANASAEKAAYKTNSYVRRSVDLNASSVASVPFIVTDDNNNEIESPNDPMIKLLNNPNKTSTRSKFLRKIITDLEVHGNAFVYIVRTVRGIEELHVIDPSRVQPDRTMNIIDPVRSWQVNFGASGIRTIPVEDMIHLKHESPDDDVLGISPVVSAARAILIQDAIRRWNLSTTENGGNPSMIVTIPRALSPDQFSKFVDALNAKYSGAGNNNKTMVLDDGKDAKSAGFTAVEMDFANSHVLYAREIAIAYGVPPEKIGDSANKTYANATEANKEYANDTVIPLLNMVWEAFDSALYPVFKRHVTYDVESVPGAKGNESEMYIALNSVNFLTINEKRKMKGYDDIGSDGDIILVPMGLAPLKDATADLPAPPMGDE